MSTAHLVPEMRTVRIHGLRRAFLTCGQGPTLVLLHGIGSDHTTWWPVLSQLAQRYTVIAPDLLGHGASDKPRADYSLGGFANGLRDLLTVLGVARATVVGHSFGGGVAMQFAYQFPERTERLVLVGSGGLGTTVNPLLRAVALPGGGPLLAAVTTRPVYHAAHRVFRLLHRTNLPYTIDLDPMTEVYENLTDPAARMAFRHVLRAVVDRRGQVVNMISRAYLAEGMPVLVVWGTRDSVVPVKHARAAREVIPGSRVEIFPQAGHFPHRDDPDAFVRTLVRFIDESPASDYDPAAWRRRLRKGPPARQPRSQPTLARSVPRGRLDPVGAVS
jgi:pimeloyl-ACP methyl ester carboxylesterase